MTKSEIDAIVEACEFAIEQFKFSDKYKNSTAYFINVPIPNALLPSLISLLKRIGTIQSDKFVTDNIYGLVGEKEVTKCVERETAHQLTDYLVNDGYITYHSVKDPERCGTIIRAVLNVVKPED